MSRPNPVVVFCGCLVQCSVALASPTVPGDMGALRRGASAKAVTSCSARQGSGNFSEQPEHGGGRNPQRPCQQQPKATPLSFTQPITRQCVGPGLPATPARSFFSSLPARQSFRGDRQTNCNPSRTLDPHHSRALTAPYTTHYPPNSASFPWRLSALLVPRVLLSIL